MVQFKASSLVLVAAIAGYAQTSVLARRSSVREYREDALSTRELEKLIIDMRAVVEEALLERRSFESESQTLSTRDSEALEQRSPEPVTNFFKGIGQFVKRMAHQYWREMQDDVAWMDLRRKHPHPDTSYRSRRHRMDGNQVDTRKDEEGFRSRRRRIDNGHVTRRSSQDDFQDRRRRFAQGQIVRRQTDELLPRMSWYGKALLIYRDMKHPASDLFSRSTAKPERRDVKLSRRNKSYRRSLNDLD